MGMSKPRTEGGEPVVDWLRKIPKTETHLHIEGALPYTLLRELDPDRFPANPFFREPGYRFPNFVDFETLLVDHAVAWYTSPERYHEACKLIFSGLADQNVKYLETSLHLAIIEFTGSDGHELIHAIKSAAPKGLEIRVIAGLTRDGYTEVMSPIIDSLPTWDDLDGIDLHGQEWLKLEAWTPRIWKQCKEAGKIIKVHAGEFGGADKIYEALDLLGAERIQHGTRAFEDPDLVQRLADEGVILDMCPISNEKLRVVEQLEDHPIRGYFDAGVTCTINTDDPLCFANTLSGEYEALHDRLGFKRSELAKIAENGFRFARMDEELKNSYIAEIDSLLSEEIE